MKHCPEVEEDIEHPVRRKKKNFADDLHDLNNNLFVRVQMRPELLNGCPPGSDAIAHPSGWIKYFMKFTHPSEENPILLIADNHSSHCSLDTINVCRSNSIKTY
ncbi:hypothetical protein ILUMI_12287 [Ignelater luminosus]|uniref:DDE-1 domain-containing protein n=1 Tax=Ignelater luminosus TaxID=2038154 RepID=A0A8K0GCF9_IGNLU|nr:hypothetical protein ILUMI_12287 [Ignelater luminosus]